MKKSCVRTLAFFVCAVLSLALLSSCASDSVPDFEVPSPDGDYFVLDSANVLSEGTEDYMIDLCRKLYASTGAQIVFVTVPDTAPVDCKTYASHVFDKWGIGSGSDEKGGGILILFSISNEKYWVMQGNGTGSTLSVEDIRNLNNTYVEPKFAEGDYDASARSGFDAYLAATVSVYGINLDDVNAQGAEMPDPSKTVKAEAGNTTKLVKSLIIVALSFAAIALIIKLASKIHINIKRRPSKRGPTISIPPADYSRSSRRSAPVQRTRSQAPRYVNGPRPQSTARRAAPRQQGTQRRQTGNRPQNGNRNGQSR